MNAKKQNMRNKVVCLNPWDIQSKHVFDVGGICESLYAGECRWGGGEHYVCYAIEGNVVDRVSNKNGKGWCEDVSPTLNTQDRHAVVYTIDAMSSNSMKSPNPNSGIHETTVSKCLDTMCLDPSCNQGGHMVVVYDGSSVTSPDNWNNPHPGDPCYSLHTDSRNYVVISLEGNGARPSHMGKGFSEDGSMYTLNTIEQHSVCYEKPQACELLCYEGQNCNTDNRTAFTIQASRPDDHHIPTVCYKESK